MQPPEITFRKAEHLDLPFLSETEKLSILDPWNLNLLLEALISYEFRIGEWNDKPVGFFVYNTVLDEAELYQIAVHPKFRRKGFGSAFLKQMETECRDKKVCRLLLEVRESNIGARQLYLKDGWQVIGTRKNYYRTPTGRETAIIMEKLLNA